MRANNIHVRKPKIPPFNVRVRAYLHKEYPGLPSSTSFPSPYDTRAWKRMLHRERLPINARHRVTRLIRRSLRFLQSQGYLVARAPENAPGFHILTVGSDGPALIHVTRYVRGSGWPSGEVLESLRRFNSLASVKKIIHRWRAFARTPDVREIHKGPTHQD